MRSASPARAGTGTARARRRARARSDVAGPCRRAALRARRGGCRGSPRRSPTATGASSRAVQIWSTGSRSSPQKLPAVLVPGQRRASARRLREEHGAVEGHRLAERRRGRPARRASFSIQARKKADRARASRSSGSRREGPASRARTPGPRSAPGPCRAGRRDPRARRGPSMMSSARARRRPSALVASDAGRAAPSRARGSGRARRARRPPSAGRRLVSGLPRARRRRGSVGHSGVAAELGAGEPSSFARPSPESGPRASRAASDALRAGPRGLSRLRGRASHAYASSTRRHPLGSRDGADDRSTSSNIARDQ